jgi:hypothetical protein
MANRPDPVQFARISYYLAIATATILGLTVLLGMLRIGMTWIVWIALITSAVGAFLAWAARSDFKVTPGPTQAVKMARSAWRVNFYALLLLILSLLLMFGLRYFLGSGPLQITVGG